jgi:hypothetical protein
MVFRRNLQNRWNWLVVAIDQKSYHVCNLKNRGWKGYLLIKNSQSKSSAWEKNAEFLCVCVWERERDQITNSMKGVKSSEIEKQTEVTDQCTRAMLNLQWCGAQNRCGTKWAIHYSTTPNRVLHIWSKFHLCSLSIQIFKHVKT